MTDLIVTVKQGKLRGFTDTDTVGKPFLNFLGIPYAKPPLGKLRFKAPQPPESWEGVRDATKNGCCCTQQLSEGVNVVYSGSEDSLFLNVFTRELQNIKSKPKPVMFWVHGGGFLFGSNNTDLYGPNRLMTEDIVLVTINYRLGIFGFLCLEDSSLGVPGNAAFKDMVLALKWVRENIKAFGGDPENVTIFGESAGSAAIQYLLLSPLTKGLFHKAILQSGAATNSWAQGTRGAKHILKAINEENEDEKTLLKKLLAMTTQEIYNIQTKVSDKISTGYHRAFCGVVENTTLEPMFLSKDPLDLMISGEYNQVPIIMGYVTNEAYVFHNLAKFGILPFFLSGDEHIVPMNLGLQKNSKKFQETADAIKNFYFGNDEFKEEVLPYFTLAADNLVVRDVYTSIKHFARASKFPVYFYKMTIETKLNLFKAMSRVTFPGATHADDLAYLFTSKMCPPVSPRSIEDLAIKRFVKLWTNFAKTGNPNNANEEVLKGVEWKPATADVMNYLDIGKKLESKVNPDADRMKFWEQLFKSISTSKL